MKQKVNTMIGFISVLMFILTMIMFAMMLSLIHINERIITIEEIDSIYDSKYIDVDIHNQYPDDDIDLIRYFKGDIQNKK